MPELVKVRHLASMDWYGADGYCEVRVPCTVDFVADKITVTYMVEGESYSYSGQDCTGHGHYVLRFDNGPGAASLFGVLPRDMPGATGTAPARLEGSYTEEGVHGMWRLDINPEPLSVG